MTDTNQLLPEYNTSGSEPAFREIVSRYVDLVHSVAVRRVGSNEHLALTHRWPDRQFLFRFTKDGDEC